MIHQRYFKCEKSEKDDDCPICYDKGGDQIF